MKTSRTWVACLIMGMATLVIGGLTSCTKDEPTPVIVENPLDAEVYYIAGQVTDGSKGLEGVQISTTDATATSASDGTFQLAVKKKGVHVVTLSKTGYITVSTEEEIPSDMQKNSSVSFFHEMTPANEAVTVRPDRDTVIVEKKMAVASLFIQAGALTKTTDIAITEFKMRLKGTVILSMLNCMPDGLTFEKPVTMFVKNAASSHIHFADVIHSVQKDGKWQPEGMASFDASKNTYEGELNGFSNHSFMLQSTEVAGGRVSAGSTSIVVDNLGQMGAKEQTVTVTQKIGWGLSGDLPKSLQEQFIGLSQSDADNLSAQLQSAIASSRGSAADSKEIPLSLGVAKVSGDTKMTIEVVPQTQSSTITFNLNYQGRIVPFTVTVIDYTGISIHISYQYGESHKDHSGGSGM